MRKYIKSEQGILKVCSWSYFKLKSDVIQIIAIFIDKAL